jgi:hypothetical protein
VVKNVTGYDMIRLLVGSHHRFGVPLTSTLRLIAKPETTWACLLHGTDWETLYTLCMDLQDNGLAPVILTCFRTKTTFGWHVLLTISGSRSCVPQKRDAVLLWANRLPNSQLQDMDISPETLAKWRRRLDWIHPGEPDMLIMNVALPPAEIRTFPDVWLTEAWPCLSLADVLIPLNTGQIYLRWGAQTMPEPDEMRLFQQAVRSMGGLAQVVRMPMGYPLDVLSFNRDPQRAVQQWEDRLKKAFDPLGVLAG